MLDKRRSLADVVATVAHGSIVALGGNTIHRAPAAAVHELARQRTRGLELVKTAGAYDVDLLCGLGCVAAVSAGFIGYETGLGLAPLYRRAVESGVVQAREHACYTVIAGLRAAAQGVPFMPVNALQGSDLPAARDFRSVRDPYSERDVVVIPAIVPDVAFIHVQEADPAGNARITGSVFEDTLMVRAARRVILTAERIVASGTFAVCPERTTIPHFLVEAVVEVPGGAWPTSCAGFYDSDRAFLARFVAAASAGEAALRQVVDEALAGPPSRLLDDRGAAARGGARQPTAQADPQAASSGIAPRSSTR
ncbi:MAG: CoA transferase subunit A [Chloroflexi bacterium]|nr:CoA transferase subunit A [Chloroflexota bacterium]